MWRRYELEYLQSLIQFDFKTIYSEVEKKPGPVTVRFDINTPINKEGRIDQNGEVNLRLEENAYLIKAYSKVAPLILMGHQGRKNPPDKKPDKDFVNLLDHHQILSNISGMRIHFVEWAYGETWEDYSINVEKFATNLKKGEAVLLDNTRIWDFEKDFRHDSCPFIPFFEDLGLSAFINDALPVWHREDSSLMFGRHVAPTSIGHLSMKELRIQRKIINESGRKIIIIGGKKPKFEAIPKLADIMDVLTAGVTGILTAKYSGYEVGALNEQLLSDCFKGMEKELKGYESAVNEYHIHHPVDFMISQSTNLALSNRLNVSIKDLNKPEYEEYMIYDIGKETIREYSKYINNGSYDWRIRAGPNGVYEEGFDNGIRLIENILGTGFVAIGGDTVEELQKYGICKPIMYSDGAILLGGGSHIEGFAGTPYPCIEDLLTNGSISWIK